MIPSETPRFIVGYDPGVKHFGETIYDFSTGNINISYYKFELKSNSVPDYCRLLGQFRHKVKSRFDTLRDAEVVVEYPVFGKTYSAQVFAQCWTIILQSKIRDWPVFAVNPMVIGSVMRKRAYRDSEVLRKVNRFMEKWGENHAINLTNELNIHMADSLIIAFRLVSEYDGIFNKFNKGTLEEIVF